MKRMMCAMLALGMLALGMCFAAAEEAGAPFCPAVEAEAGAATTAGEDNGLTVEGGEDALPEAWREIDGPADGEATWREIEAMADGEEAWREIEAPADGEDEADPEAEDEVCLPAPDGEAAVFAGEEYIAEIETGADGDALFASYAERYFYGGARRRLMASRNAGNRLEGQDRLIYDAIQPEIVEIAEGRRTSTVFCIPLTELLGKARFTAKDLGVEVRRDSSGSLTDECLAGMGDAYRGLFSWDVDRIGTALWHDCPYELYWFSRYQGYISVSTPGYRIGYDSESEDYVLYTSETDGVTLRFAVLNQYAGSEPYTVDPSLIESARQAADNAKDIVAKYADCSDYVKLYGYALEICRLVDYNQAAYNAGSGWDMTEQNPWKLIWVFDGDPATSVVCEGYTQAFQYLCEMAGFDAGICCYYVGGQADGGGHAWNVVTMDDGKNYLVDVTWMDGDWVDGLTGDLAKWINDREGCKLFLVGAESGSAKTGFTVKYRDGDRTTRRVYDRDMLGLYPASVLTLAASAYIPKGFNRIDGADYYFDDEGHYVTGQLAIGDMNYVFDENGRMHSGWAKGWQTVDGKRYYFDENGLHVNHTAATVKGVAATCTASGLTDGEKCQVCGEWLAEQQVIPAKGHVSEAVPGRAATCTETGLTDGEKCRVCGEWLAAQQTIAAKGHTPEAVPGRAATCTETGLTDGEKCQVCGAITVAQEIILAKGHTPEAVLGRAATCTEDGLTDGEKCAVCGTITKAQETILAKGHSPEIMPAVAATTTSTGLSEGKRCSVCGEILEAQQVIARLPEDPTQPGEPSPVHRTVVLKKNARITVNAKDTIQIVVGGKKVKSFKSDNTAVAKVNKKGFVTTKYGGTAKITVTLKTGKKLVLTVKVSDPRAPKKVAIAKPGSKTVKVGKKLALKVKLTPEDAETALSWSSSDRKVATVSAKGVVKGVKPGTAVITVKAANGKKAKIKIVVKK